MKKTVLGAALLTAVSLVAYGQGNFNVNNSGNQDGTYSQVYSAATTSGGLLFTENSANQLGTFLPAYYPGSQLYYNSAAYAGTGGGVNIAVFGGATAATATQLLGVWSVDGTVIGQSLSTWAANNGGFTVASGEPYSTVQDGTKDVVDAGVFQDPLLTQMEIPGVTSSPGYLNIWVWEGAMSYANALTSGYAGTTGVFAKAVTTGTTPGLNLTDMPNVMMYAVPEPTTFAMLGLGLASLLTLRRRRK